ncbi:MAG: ATP-binding protein [Saprospiraceae bacterium]
MSTHIGTPAQGANFFGRSKMLDKLKNSIVKGMHVLLSGPRRVGKTSIALRLLYLLKKDNWNGIYVTFEGAQDETVIAQRILTALQEQETLWKNSQTTFENIFKNANLEIKGFGVKIKYKRNDNSVAHLLETFGKAIQSIKGNFLIIIDELPVFLASLESKEDGKERVKSFLNVLRSFRQYDQNDDKDKKVWFFCGSISLESFAANRNLSYTINDIRPFKLGAYDQYETIEYLDLACKKSFITCDNTVRDHIITKVGWPIPFYLAIVFDAALQEMNGKVMEVTHIDVGYKNALNEHKKDFDLWIQRLQLHIAHPEVHIEFLKLIATKQNVDLDYIKAYIISTEWSNLKELHLIPILDQLEADGYIVLENRSYYYRSPLIRDYIIHKFHLDKNEP